MILELPDLRLDKDYDCGAAAVDVVTSYHGLRARGVSKYANAVQGMAPDTVAAILRAVGLRVLAGQMLGGVEDLRHYTRQGLPVLCCVALAGGHWVVVAGVERGRVYYHDPSHGMQSMKIADWLTCWRDTSAESAAEFRQWGIVTSR